MSIARRSLRALLVLLLPAIAGAARIDVPAGTSLQVAVDAAAPGDALVLEQGVYPGAVVIDKRLRIVGQGTAEIEPPVDAVVGLDIVADGVTIRVKEGAGYGLAVGCGTDAALRIHNRDSVRIRSVSAGCFNGPAVGLDVMNVTSSTFKFMLLFGNPGVRVRQLGVRPGVRFSRVDAHGGEVGVLLEDIAAGGGRNSGIRIRNGLITRNGPGAPVALQLVNADGTVISGANLVGELHLDAGSDNNLVRGSQMGPVTDLGTGNCFVNNQSSTPDVCP